MPKTAKNIDPKKKPARKPHSTKTASPALRKTETPAERLRRLLKPAHARGLNPMNASEFDAFIEEHRDAWPDQREIDEFVAWIHMCRKKGRYN